MCLFNYLNFINIHQWFQDFKNCFNLHFYLKIFNYIFKYYHPLYLMIILHLIKSNFQLNPFPFLLFKLFFLPSKNRVIGIKLNFIRFQQFKLQIYLQLLKFLLLTLHQVSLMQIFPIINFKLYFLIDLNEFIDCKKNHYFRWNMLMFD